MLAKDTHASLWDQALASLPYVAFYRNETGNLHDSACLSEEGKGSSRALLFTAAKAFSSCLLHRPLFCLSAPPSRVEEPRNSDRTRALRNPCGQFEDFSSDESLKIIWYLWDHFLLTRKKREYVEQRPRQWKVTIANWNREKLHGESAAWRLFGNFCENSVIDFYLGCDSNSVLRRNNIVVKHKIGWVKKFLFVFVEKGICY